MRAQLASTNAEWIGGREAQYRGLARSAGLEYVSDDSQGISRIRRGKRFHYHRAKRRIRSQTTVARCDFLRIPPAWNKVWICPNPEGHLQASGRDARARKQYRYHDRWNHARDQAKYDRMIAFAQQLPRLRRRISRDLGRKGLPRERVLAAIVRLLEGTLIRVGNEEYAKSNGTYGLTTIRDQHVRVRGSRITFSFNGKGGIRHDLDVCDRRLAPVVKRCRALPGSEVFQYVDYTGKTFDLKSRDVNDYLRAITGENFTAKDFRTWAATVLAVQSLQRKRPARSAADAKRELLHAIDSVAAQLGNTRAVCRKSYIHPAVLASYLAGSLRRCGRKSSKGSRRQYWSADEDSVLRLLERRARHE